MIQSTNNQRMEMLHKTLLHKSAVATLYLEMSKSNYKLEEMLFFKVQNLEMKKILIFQTLGQQKLYYDC